MFASFTTESWGRTKGHAFRSVPQSLAVPGTATNDQDDGRQAQERRAGGRCCLVLGGGGLGSEDTPYTRTGRESGRVEHPMDGTVAKDGKPRH